MTPTSSGPTGPKTGADIVKEMFEGPKQEELNNAQRTANLQESARSQEVVREGTREASREQSEEVKRDRTEGQERQGQQTRGKESLRTQRQQKMDSFLSRRSTQQQSREAGREMGRDRRVRTHNPQSWTVATSRHTSSKARQTIMNRQNARASQQASTPRGQNLPRTPQQPTQTQQRWTPSTPLNIRYAQPQPRNQPNLLQRPFSGRFDAARNLSQQINRMITGQRAAQGDQASQNRPTVLVHLRGQLIFVRDGGKTRAFKLNKDGSLSELPTEDASDQPLSPEARAHLKKVLRQRGVRSHLGGRQSDAKGEVSEAKSAQILAEKGSGQAKEGEGALDFETKFALLLYEALEEHKKVGKKLGEGEDPAFPTKKDWAAFFAKLAQMGNKEKSGKKSLDQILKLIFRGMFNKKGKGAHLVGDLKFLKEGKNREEKFTQIAISDQDFSQLLLQLKPGQTLSVEQLRKLFGEELSYLMMAHTAEMVLPLADAEGKNIAFNPKAQVDPFSQARLENKLFEGRRNQKSAEGSGTGQESPAKGPQSSGVFANVYELMGLRKLYEGNPKLYTAIAYLGMTAAAGLILAFTLLGFLK